MKNTITLEDVDKLFPTSFSEEQLSRAKTIFFKKLADLSHRYYNGKIQVVPKVPNPGFNWFNVWYTPGVSSISTSIRDNNDESFELSNRGNMVAVVSDSTRVLGDGDVTPPGGLGVMEGKAFLMKYLGGVDAVPLCIDSKNEKGENDPDNIIKFVQMVQHSFGAINLEDISQPNCFKVLDTLRESCDIPVWHDDAQGTACVTLAGLINSLKIVNKKIENVRIILYGAGASNTTIARLLIASGADPANIIVFDSKGSLNKDREDIKNDNRYYRKWELCLTTNPDKINDITEAMRGADVLISLSTPGPNTIKQEWIKLMAEKAIVFACANPIPEIYPYAAKEAGAYVVATGRGDFPNQVNNSLGFPGILKGALMVRSKKITDEMAIAAANALAKYAYDRGIDANNIMPTMDESDVFPIVAATVAMESIKNGVARKILNYQEAYQWAKKDITYARELTDSMIKNDFILLPPEQMIKEALEYTIGVIDK